MGQIANSLNLVPAYNGVLKVRVHCTLLICASIDSHYLIYIIEQTVRLALVGSVMMVVSLVQSIRIRVISRQKDFIHKCTPFSFDVCIWYALICYSSALQIFYLGANLMTSLHGSVFLFHTRLYPAR